MKWLATMALRKSVSSVHASVGEASAESDIDILVAFDQPVGFFRFLEIEEQLSEWLGAKVDLVTRAALKPYIGRNILSEVVML